EEQRQKDRDARHKHRVQEVAREGALAEHRLVIGEAEGGRPIVDAEQVRPGFQARQDGVVEREYRHQNDEHHQCVEQHPFGDLPKVKRRSHQRALPSKLTLPRQKWTIVNKAISRKSRVAWVLPSAKLSNWNRFSCARTDFVLV